MKKIVVGYDGTEIARRALERAARLGADELIVISVAPKQPAGGRIAGIEVVDPADLEEHERELAEAKQLLDARGAEVRFVEASGDPADALVATADSEGADLIVVGTRGLNAVTRALYDSVSTKVLHHAHCDVLVVR